MKLNLKNNNQIEITEVNWLQLANICDIAKETINNWNKDQTQKGFVLELLEIEKIKTSCMLKYDTLILVKN